MKKMPLLLAAMFAALTSAYADDLAITPATLPVATQMVAYAQTFTATGGEGSYSWSVVPWSYETAEPTYSVGANEVSLWDGTAMKGNTAYRLPFTFTYCGTQYDTIYVDSHGFLLFDPRNSSSDYAHTSYLSYGYTGLAVLWKNYASASGWADTSVAGQVSFRFEMSYESGDTTYTWAHKTTLYSDGRIRFAYRQDANDSVPDNFAIGLAVGNMRADYSYASLPLAGDGDAIPSNDFVFRTYGVPEGFTCQERYDSETWKILPTLYGTGRTPCTTPFALSVKDTGTGAAVTNVYDFVIEENPDKEPVIDAVSPATTNVVHELSIGDTMAFHVGAHDLADGPFDINWVFYRENSDYAATTNIGSGADFTFEATRALYDFQYSSGESILKCIVSDAVWTNSVTWRVYIRRDAYVDATAAEGGDGSSAAPYTNIDNDYFKRGDRIVVAPGRYELDYLNLGSKRLDFVATGGMDDTTFAFTSSYSLSGNSGDRSSFTGFTLENIQYADYMNFADCKFSGVKNRDFGIQHCNLTGCCVWGCSVSRNLFTDCTLTDCTVAGNALASNVADSDSYGMIGSGCHIERTIIANNFDPTGVEANFNTDSYDIQYITATNCCTIPAMTDYGPGNYEADPKFVYPTQGDLRLRAGSGCLAENPANNTGAYKGAGVEGFVVHAFTDPVRGKVEPALQIVGGSPSSATVTATAVTNRAFLGWTTNGCPVAAAPSPSLTLENIDCDYEVEALFEYKEFYVNPTEVDDTGDGSAAAPKKTIAAAAALALEGETIRLAEGTYEPFALTGSLDLTLIGAGAGKTVIDGGFTNTCVRLGANMTLKNASVINGSAKNYAGGVYGGMIENCVVSNCASRSYSTCYAAGVYQSTVISSLIANNVNTNSTYSGYAGGVRNCKVYNSTIANNVSAGYPGGAYYSHLKNCIVYGNTAKSGYSEYNEIGSCQNETLSTGISDDIVAQSNLIGVDPWFIDAANGDYRLTAGSPAIDVGEDVPAFDFAHATDLAGERRIKNAIVDYGCYEGGVVTGAPAAPVATATSDKAANGVPLAWSALPNAAEYRIYRAAANAGGSPSSATAELIGTTTATSYKDMTGVGGTTYYYWISAYNSQFGESEKCGPLEATAMADLAIDTASLPAATEAVSYSVQLECSGNTGAVEWSLPYTAVTREASTFDGTVGTDAWDLNGNGSVEVTTTHLQTNVIVTLPFNFTWFGKTYNQVNATTHGGLYFGLEETWPGWSYYSIAEAPKIAVLEGVSGWNDSTRITAYSIDIQADAVTIVYKGNYGAYSSSTPAEFSVTISSDNTIRLAYGSCSRGGYIAYSNGSDDTKTQLYRTRDEDFSNMDDIVIASLPNESGLELSADGVLSGIIDWAGDCKVTALVHDTGYGDSVWKTWTLTVDPNANTRPVIDSTTPAEGKVIIPQDDTNTFTVVAHDPEGAALTYKWYLNDELVSSGSSSYSFSSNVGGVFTLACEVSDALWTNGQVSAEWDVRVGQKLYVDAASTAGDEADGTKEKPLRDISEAMNDWAGDNVTIYVAPGTYGPVRFWDYGYAYGGWAPVMDIRATGSAANTIIDGGTTNMCIANYNRHDGLTFTGFTLQNGYADEEWSPTSGGGGAYSVNLKECVVRNCVAERGGGGVSSCNLEYCTVINNTAGTGGGMDAYSTADHSIIWGNVATNAGASAEANYAPGAVLTYCCATPLPDGEGNISDDPLFTNLAAGDWSLRDGSPCLDPRIGCYGEGGDAPPPVGVTYTVTFDANGGTCAEATRTVAKGKAVGTLPTATRAGYSLKGWYTKKTDGTKISASTTVSKDVTYYAQWTALPKYTVTFNANGGTCATASRQVAQGEGVGELPEATRDGWDFVGWFTAKTGGSQVTAATVVTKAVTYYARWTEHYELVIDENGVLTGLTGTTPATVDVPATVTAFAANLFKGVTKITSVTGGANVTACGAGAFRDSGIWNAAPNGPVVVCGVLVGYKGTVPATVDVPAGVRVIADGAFAGATSLATVYLPDSLVAIGDGAFKNCAKLDDVIGLEDGVTVADNAFEDTLYATFRLTWSGTVVTGFKGPIAAEIVIPANATGIGVGAFKDQTAITAVTIGTNVTIIGASAFKGCTGLTEVRFGNSDSSDTGANAPDNGNAQALASASDKSELISIGASAFEGCAALVAFDIPASVTTIGASAFQGCATLATVTGGGSVETIRTDAFAGTPWYEAAPAEAFEEVRLGHVLVRMKGDVPDSYEISTNVWMVADNAFAGVTTLSDLYIGTEVVSLWDRAFAGCTSLGSVTVPSGCREFGDYLFDGCTSLTNVYFRGHAPTNDVPHVFSGTPETLKVRVKEGSRGWIAPGSDSDLVPARWPYKTGNGEWGTGNGALVPNDLNRAVADPEDLPGVVRSVIVDGTITNDTTWVGGKVYEIQSGCYVEKGATLTIEEGAIVKLPLDKRNGVYGYFPHSGGYAGLSIGGKLVANGTKADPIVFTSITDDSYGGDTNGDGDRSEPYPGDNRGVGAFDGGSIDATFAKFLYGNATNGRGNHACLSAFMTGAKSTFYGCEFSHAAMDGCFVSDGYLENCIITDCDRGLVGVSNEGSYNGNHRDAVAVNCVICGNRVGTFGHTADVYVTNSIVAFNSEVGLSGDSWYGGRTYATRCCLYNPSGENASYKNGRTWIFFVDNIEADPLFVDPENGDFRISPESPCVDAGYGDIAPELDYYGQPRMDVKYVRNTGTPNAAGEYPDIGLYEVPGTTERPVMNLEVENVAIVANGANSQLPITIAPGETLTVNYTVRNTGTVAAKGSIRDTVRIKSAANGGTMVAGTVTQLYNLEAGGEAQFVATVTMPAAPAGEWLVGIDVNPNRDVFEQNFLKNALWTEDAIEVALPEMTMGMTGNAAVPAATTVGYMLKDVPEEGGIVVITAAGTAALPVIARVATGHMPTAAMNDATSFVRADGAIVLVVPPHAAGEAVYLAIENTGVESVTLNSQLTTLNLDLWSVYPETIANVGDMGFTFTGSGLSAESDFRLGGIKAKSATAIDSANVYAVFDVQGIAADCYYDVSADGKTIRDAVYVNKVAKGPILEAKLELPDRVRDNRVYTGYVVYENTGDTQMNAPTFYVDYAGEGTNTVLGAYDEETENMTQERVVIVGLGSSHPAGILKPGDSGRLPFKFKPVGSYKFQLESLYTDDDVASAATRLNLRGGPVRFDGYAIRGLANLVKKGETAAAVSGYLLDVRTREPLAGAALKLALKTGNGEQGTGNGEESFARVVTTDDDGYFQFEQLKDGSYELVADRGYTLVTTNLIEVAGQSDVNGYEATALPPGIVSGYVIGEDGTVVQYGEVTLFRSANDMEGETVTTDGYGAYRFTGLEDGAYAVYARPYGAFKGLLATNAVVSVAARELRLDFALSLSARAYGTVTRWKGGAAEGGEVRFYQEDGNFFKADVATNGTWEAAGLAPGKYSVGYVSADGLEDSVSASVTIAAGDETEIPILSQPAVPFQASTSFGVIDAKHPTLTVYFAATGYASDTNVASVVWSFGDEGETTYETNSTAIAHVYRDIGTFTVSAQPRYEDGTLGSRFELRDFLLVTNELETIYKENAIVLGGYSPEDVNFKTNAGTLVVTGVGDDWVTLTGAPGAVSLAAGTVIAGTYTNADGEDDWFLRRIVGVSGDETGWTLATEHGNEEDLYEQYWSYWSDGAAEAQTAQAQTQSAANGRVRSLKSIGSSAVDMLKKVSGSIEKGIEFEVDCSPDLQYHYSCYITKHEYRKVTRYMYGEAWEFTEDVGPKRRELRIWGDVSLSADITATAEFKGGWEDEQEYELVPKAVQTLPSAAKAIPYFKIGYNASGTISGSAHAKAEVKGYLDIGFVKESGKDIEWHKSKPFAGNVDLSFDPDDDIDASIGLEASVSAGFGVKVKAFEVVTASADVMFNAKAAIECPKNSPASASISIGYDTNVSMNFIDLTWLNKDWKVGMDWTIEGPTLWSMKWISPKPDFSYRNPHAKEWPTRIAVTDRSRTGTFVDSKGRTFPIPISSVDWDYGQGEKHSYSKSQIDSGAYKTHFVIKFPGDQEEGEYVVSLNVQGGVAPSLWPCQKKVKVKKPDEPEKNTKIKNEEWFDGSTQKSVDPNEMAGPEGVGENRYVKPGEPMTYTIYFENKADAAIAAQEVFVDNALSEYLDWSTFEMKTVSVGGQIINGLDGYTAAYIAGLGGTAATEIDQTNGLYKTRVELQYDATEGIASWYIRVVDIAKRGTGNGERGTDGGECWPDDPDAGVLQPNVVSPEGEGYITYSMCVREDAPANAIIDNSANIVFDQNAAIVTDPAWWNTVSSVEEVLEQGEYVKMTLAELGFDVPTDGKTAYTVVAKGLPAGLKLVGNKAVKDKKGKIVKKANVEWWIEGVPTAVLEFCSNPPYLVITANGKTETLALPVEVVAQEVADLGELALGESVNTNGWLEGVGAGWTVSGLPTGLKYATKRVTKKSGKKTIVVAEAYAVYGKTTKAGLFTITAKKKVNGYYETKKFKVLVRPNPVNAAIFSDSLTNMTTMAYVPFMWELTNDVSSVSVNVAKVTGLPTGLTFAAANTYAYTNPKKNTGKYLKQAGQTIVGTPTKAGTYVVTFTKNFTTGTGKNKKTVAKTAQILWTVVKNDAELELGFNTQGGEIVSGVVGLNYGNLMAFSATDGATVTASGLPAGITLANLGGGAYAFTGFTAKAGTYLVTVKATLNGKTVTQRLALKVDGLPAWAKGTYNGYVLGTGNGELGTGNWELGTGNGSVTNGLATVTVSTIGKISGKFYEGGTNWTLTAASYTGCDPDATNYTATVMAKYSWKVKSGKKTITKSVSRTFALTVTPVPVVMDVSDVPVRGVAKLTEITADETGGSQSSATEIEAYQNLWGSTYKAVGKALFSSKSGKKTLAYKTFTIKGGTDLGTEIGLRESDSLTLKITTAGAVTATLTFDTGKTKKDAKTKKTVKVYYKPTCSTVVIPTSAADAETFTGRVPLFMPSSAANNFPGLCMEVAYPFVAHGVPGPDGGSSWFTGEFNGYGDAQFPAGDDTEFLNGLFTVNVASSLAFTGTFTGTDGSTASFSGTFAKDGSSYVANGVSITVKGATMSMTLSCDPGPYAGSDEGFGEMGGGSSAGPDEPCISLNCAWQNIWKRSDLAAEWKPAFAAGTAKSILLEEGFLDGLSEGDSLTYAFGAEGSVSITGKIYGEDVSVTAKLHLEGCDSSTDTMHCNVQFIANGHLYQQQFTFPRQATVAASDIVLSADDFNHLD